MIERIFTKKKKLIIKIYAKLIPNSTIISGFGFVAIILTTSANCFTL